MTTQWFCPHCKAEIPVGGLKVISSETRLISIVNEMCSRYGVRQGEVMGRTRSRRVVEARHAAIRVIRLQTGLSSPKIGKFFGMDHSSVLAVLNKSGRSA